MSFKGISFRNMGEGLLTGIEMTHQSPPQHGQQLLQSATLKLSMQLAGGFTALTPIPFYTGLVSCTQQLFILSYAAIRGPQESSKLVLGMVANATHYNSLAHGTYFRLAVTLSMLC